MRYEEAEELMRAGHRVRCGKMADDWWWGLDEDRDLCTPAGKMREHAKVRANLSRFEKLKARDDWELAHHSEDDWMPVSVALPDVWLEVLVTHLDADEAPQVCAACFDGEAWAAVPSFYNSRPYRLEVVAWRPLPLPYGVEG